MTRGWRTTQLCARIKQQAASGQRTLPPKVSAKASVSSRFMRWALAASASRPMGIFLRRNTTEKGSAALVVISSRKLQGLYFGGGGFKCVVVWVEEANQTARVKRVGPQRQTHTYTHIYNPKSTLLLLISSYRSRSSWEMTRVLPNQRRSGWMRPVAEVMATSPARSRIMSVPPTICICVWGRGGERGVLVVGGYGGGYVCVDGRPIKPCKSNAKANEWRAHGVTGPPRTLPCLLRMGLPPRYILRRLMVDLSRSFPPL